MAAYAGSLHQALTVQGMTTLSPYKDAANLERMREGFGKAELSEELRRRFRRHRHGARAVLY